MSMVFISRRYTFHANREVKHTAKGHWINLETTTTMKHDLPPHPYCPTAKDDIQVQERRFWGGRFGAIYFVMSGPFSWRHLKTYTVHRNKRKNLFYRLQSFIFAVRHSFFNTNIDLNTTYFELFYYTLLDN